MNKGPFPEEVIPFTNKFLKFLTEQGKNKLLRGRWKYAVNQYFEICEENGPKGGKMVQKGINVRKGAHYLCITLYTIMK